MAPISNKPVSPHAPHGPQGTPGKQPLSAEAQKRIQDATQELGQDGQPEPLAEGEQPPVPSGESQGTSETPGRPRPPGSEARRPGDEGKKSAYQHEPNETRGSHIPEKLGHNMPDLAPLLKRGEQHAEGRQDMPQDAAPFRPEGQDGPEGSQQFTRPDRPLPDRPSPQQYRALIHDKAFQGPMAGSPLYQNLQAKAVTQQRQQQMAQGQHQASEEVLKRGELAQLFRMRNAFERKDDSRAVLKYELAKARQEAKEKVKETKEKKDETGGGGEARARRSGSVRRDGDSLKEQIGEKLKYASGESEFEQALQYFLEGGESVPELPESVRASFASKTDAEWEAFFKNALELSSLEIESQGQLDKLVEALFRGTYRRGADGKMMLVSDLAFAGEAAGDVDQFKFTRIALSDPDLATLLGKLKPGDQIGKDLLSKIGDQFLFIQLLHAIEQLAVTEDQKKAILREFRQQVSSSSRDRLEKALVGRRPARDEREPRPNPLAAGAGDLFNKKERHIGPPKWLLTLIYFIISITVLLILTILLRNL